MSVIYGPDSQLPEEIASLLADLARGQQAWINGVESESIRNQHDEMTIYGPFGGPARRQKEGLQQRQAATRAQFQGGTCEPEFVQAVASDDLVVLVLLETSTVKFAGREGTHPWILRITEVYQRDGQEWRRLHRHADPLIKLRGLDDTLALLAD